ncbi:MAG: RnfABCDGE type electron transport complex subunit B [Candidatus Auribacter fodinae]|jgi:electron transport complex protein RnfB|uniref:Ion-translocating oxidoreductase complex subunit B n=1 Tax=Candidatus Auribacter fodinae TaxID=2093366 RepID=A0A3A4QZR8_9BACT|nr:MAG: RnfABCDGE type electron transport complex subunit B [Candidatus Auribacter fodinae]
MDVSIILYSVLVLGVLGVLFGIALAVSSHIFHVPSDPRVEEVYKVLPDLNCGACGYPGCKKYAEAVAKGGEKVNLCAPGGEEVAKSVAAIMGVAVDASKHKEVAFIFCCGGNEAKQLAEYQGIPDCNAAVIVGGGPLQCNYGCMRLYSCYNACNFDAIRIDEEGLPVVIPENCTACMACVKACPKNIIRMVPAYSSVFIECNSKDRGKDVMDACKRGCIGCTKCVKVCPVEAIHMEEGLAVIDHLKCNNCLKCIEVCPVKVIHQRTSPLTEEIQCPQK